MNKKGKKGERKGVGKSRKTTGTGGVIVDEEGDEDIVIGEEENWAVDPFSGLSYRLDKPEALNIDGDLGAVVGSKVGSKTSGPVGLSVLDEERGLGPGQRRHTGDVDRGKGRGKGGSSGSSGGRKGSDGNSDTDGDGDGDDTMDNAGGIDSLLVDGSVGMEEE